MNTKGKYGKITNIEIKSSIISKSVMIIIFMEFIDQLINYLINHASLNKRVSKILFLSGIINGFSAKKKKS